MTFSDALNKTKPVAETENVRKRDTPPRAHMTTTASRPRKTEEDEDEDEEEGE